jgi:DNA primase small subunit
LSYDLLTFSSSYSITIIFTSSQVELATDKNKDVHLPSPLHPMLTRAYKILEPHFISKVLPSSGHGLLATPENWTNFLQTLPDTASDVRDKLLQRWNSNKDTSTPEEKWMELKTHLQSFCKASAKAGANKSQKNMSSTERSRLENWKYETVFLYTYPRLDINVSTHRNHLLKSPFCVHPKTGRVCVPFSAERVRDFDPFVVPTLGQLMKELDASKDKESNDENEPGSSNNGKLSADWQQTSLKPYFERFEKEFLKPLCKSLQSKRRDEAEQVAALTGDF